MILKNVTKERVGIKYKGRDYSIEAESNSQDLPEEVANHWRDNVHQFLQIVSAADIIEEKEESTESEAEEVEKIAKEEEAEKAPAKKAVKKAVKKTNKK